VVFALFILFASWSCLSRETTLQVLMLKVQPLNLTLLLTFDTWCIMLVRRFNSEILIIAVEKFSGGQELSNILLHAC